MNKNNGIFQVVLVVLLVGAAFAVGSMWTELKMIKSGGDNKPAAKQQEAAQPQEAGPLSEEVWKEVVADPFYSEGEAGAPVTLVEFTDYQCPFCKRHFDETEGQIQDEYIKTGKVRWIIRDLPLSFHQNAELAAQAARCAGDQDKYRQMHDKLFATQTAWGESTTAVKVFTGYATGLGLNGTTFSQCLTSGKYKEAVAADAALAAKAGANGTPSFFVNGKPLIGAQPFSVFKQEIDAAL